VDGQLRVRTGALNKGVFVGGKGEKRRLLASGVGNAEKDWEKRGGEG